MNIFFLLIGCVPCCTPDPVEVEPVKQFDNFDNQEKIKTDPVRCEPDVRDCYIAPTGQHSADFSFSDEDGGILNGDEYVTSQIYPMSIYRK